MIKAGSMPALIIEICVVSAFIIENSYLVKPIIL